MDDRHYLQMFEEEERDHGKLGLYPFCVGVISAIVEWDGYSSRKKVKEIKKALEALETVKEE